MDDFCQLCLSVWDTEANDETPVDAISMQSNWCPKCEDTGSLDSEYEEWFVFKTEEEEYKNPNQLKLFC